jgi:hypothetical protein
MKLIFPNLQNEEGKTICQLFTVDFLKFLQEKGAKVKMVDLNNMVSELEGALDLDKSFDEYLNKVFDDGLLSYNYTSKLIGRGKVDIAKKVANPDKVSDFTKRIFEPSGDEFEFKDMGERLFAGHIEGLHSIRNDIDDIESHRCVQSGDEKGSVCNVCGLVEGKKSDITERISLVADKCWKPLGQYEQLKGCRRCAYVLGLISNMRFLWRVNISGKNGKARYSVVPRFKIDTKEPIIIDKIIEYSSYLGLFRTRMYGTTSFDYILNSLKVQPIIAKIVADGEINLMVFSQSATGQGGFVTENVISSQKIQQIAKFAMFLNKYFPKSPYSDGGAQLKTFSRIISDTAYIYTTKGRSEAMCRFFMDISTDFDVLLDAEVLGGKVMKVEYFKNKEAIQNMNEYEWDNPLVRVSTFFVAERAYQAKKDGKKPEQAINSPMALFNSIPEKEKNKTIRQYIEEITNNGKSPVLGRIDRPEEFLSDFSKALNYCDTKRLKEIVRYMRVFTNTYQYKKAEEKDAILKETLEKLGYSLKPWEERT